METHAELVAPCPPEVLFRHVVDLDRYPSWMQLVHRATREPDVAAWSVELRTRVGPLARSKRLRMVRTGLVPDRSVVFERAETDGRRHSPWVLRATVTPEVRDDGTGGDRTDEDGTGGDGTGEDDIARSRLVMHLSYGGALWTGGVLQRILDDEIRAGSERLLAIVSGETTR